VIVKEKVRKKKDSLIDIFGGEWQEADLTAKKEKEVEVDQMRINIFQLIEGSKVKTQQQLEMNMIH